MKCPQDKTKLEMLTRHDVDVERCPSCNGLWFPQDNLRRLKDEEDPFLRWVDIDPWEDAEKFRLSSSGRVCPVDGLPMYRVAYDGSDVVIDVCAERHGVWLDEGEFRALLDWFHARIEQESLLRYVKDVAVQAAEVITGPEDLRSEAADFVIVSRLLAYRLLAQFPSIGALIANLPT